MLEKNMACFVTLNGEYFYNTHSSARPVFVKYLRHGYVNENNDKNGSRVGQNERKYK